MKLCTKKRRSASFRFNCTHVVLVISFMCLIGRIVFADEAHNLQKRALLFPINSAMGYLFALAVPLDLPDRNVFLSHTVEANYGLPTNSTIVTNPDFWKINTVPNARNLTKRDVASYGWSRKLIYTIIINKIERYGLPGERCLLRLICEAAETPLYEHNGILGDIVHILLSPSQSMNENLLESFEAAERDGSNGDCKSFHSLCPVSILDRISSLAS